MRRSDIGGCSAEIIVATCLLKFTVNAASNFDVCTLFLCLYCVLPIFFFAELSIGFCGWDICCICRPVCFFFVMPFWIGIRYPVRAMFSLCCFMWILFFMLLMVRCFLFLVYFFPTRAIHLPS